MHIAFPRTRRHPFLHATITRLAAVFRLWRRERAERMELLALDDRDLRDIGLTRSDARMLADKPTRWR